MTERPECYNTPGADAVHLQRQERLLGLQYDKQHGLSSLQPDVPKFEGGA